MGLDDLVNKAKDLADEHSEQVEEAIDKAAEFVDEKTGRKHTDQIESVAEKAKGLIPDKK